MIYWTILIYTTIASWLALYTAKQRRYVSISTQKLDVIERTVSMGGAIIPFVVLIFFAGTRGYMEDTSLYIAQYNDLSTNLADIPLLFQGDQKGPLFWAVSAVIKRFISGEDFTLWLVIIACFQAFALAKYFRDYSKNFDFSCYLLISNGVITWFTNGIRQFIAVCIVLLASKYLFNKKMIKYILFVLIAYYVHDTAVLCIPVFFIVQGKPFNKRVIISMFVAIVAVMFLDQFTNALDSMLEGTSHENATQQFSEDDGANIITTILFAIPAGIAFWKRKYIMTLDRPRHIDILINMSCFTVALSLVSNFTSGILIGRLPVYFYIGNYILLPWLIEKCFVGRDQAIIRFSCYLGYLCYYAYFTSMLQYYSVYSFINKFIYA
ncbi:MAG: EpsG family protein [Acutalibacteraceae bacterium]|nr:EpsG family protein [Acutalibacteraceae bacterium]